MCEAGLLNGVQGIGQLNKVELQSSQVAKLVKEVSKLNIAINKDVQAINNRGAVSTEKKKQKLAAAKRKMDQLAQGEQQGGQDGAREGQAKYQRRKQPSRKRVRRNQLAISH